MDAFDADVLIYAAVDDPRGAPVGRLLERSHAGVGSVLLVPELLSQPLRQGRSAEVGVLQSILSRLALVPIDERIADVAALLGAKYKLRAADTVHLATAVATGADRFITNNATDFPLSISEIDVTYPDMLEL